MRQTLNGMRKRGSEDRGFTMIELLVVVVIIGVLVAIAVPVYLNYRKGAANKSAASDVRGAITAVEQYYTDNGNAYPTGTLVSTEGTALKLPATTTTTGTTTTTTVTSYKVCATNGGGSGKVYVYDSAKGGSVSALSSGSVATCS